MTIKGSFKRLSVYDNTQLDSNVSKKPKDLENVSFSCLGMGCKYSNSPRKISKTILTILLAVILSVANIVTVDASYYSDYQISEYVKTSGEILVIYNKKVIDFNMVKPFVAEGVCYVPLREIADAVNATLTWEKYSNTVHIYKEYEHIYFKTRTDFAYHNGKKIYIPPAYLYMGKTIIPLKFFCSELRLEMKWDNQLRAVCISNKGLFPTKSEILDMSPKTIVRSGPYNKYTLDDVYWLSKIVHAEANGESYRSKLAVANVILNRVNCDEYPDSIKEVIFDQNFGVQFSPTLNGSIYNQPSEESIMSAVDALNGKNNAVGILFFLNPKSAASSWIVKNRKFAFSLENHDFYY